MADKTLNIRPAMPDSADPNDARVQRLFADLNLALSFTTIAQISMNAATQQRNWAYARDAFFTIRDHLLPLCTLNDPQRTEVNSKLGELRRRLRHSAGRFGEAI